MKVVVKGVETQAQLQLLGVLGADELQGFFFSRPLPPDECEPLLDTRWELAAEQLR